MTLNFILRTNYVNKQGLQQIQLYYSSNNDQVRLDTGVRIRPKDWNEAKQQILSTVSEIGKTGKELNDILNEKKKKIHTIVSDFKKSNENGTSISPDPTPNYILENFYAVVKEIKQEKTVLEHLQDYINNRKSFLETVYEGMHLDKRAGQYKTLSHYEGLYTDLVKFSEKTRRTYYFRDITKKFKDELIKFYLYKGSKKEKKKGLSNGTLKKKFAKLKAFLNVMTEDGVNKYLTYKTFSLKEFKIAETDDNIYAMTIKEFEKFKNIPLKLEKLELARDYYLLSCASGLRWSDVCRLNKDKIKNGSIVTDIIKTKQTLTIPLNPISESIFKKYDYQLPPLSKTEMDRRLKLIWIIMANEIPSLKESTLYKYYVGGLVIPEYYPKFELLSFHTSRKYFISYLIHKKKPIDEIRKFSGHRGSLDVFFRYVYDGNFDPKENQNLFTESNLWNE
jgi:integrase